MLFDLLDPTGSRGTAKSRKDSNIDIKEHPVLGVYVAGLQEVKADTGDAIAKLMDQGNEMRAVRLQRPQRAPRPPLRRLPPRRRWRRRT